MYHQSSGKEKTNERKTRPMQQLTADDACFTSLHVKRNILNNYFLNQNSFFIH